MNTKLTPHPNVGGLGTCGAIAALAVTESGDLVDLSNLPSAAYEHPGLVECRTSPTHVPELSKTATGTIDTARLGRTYADNAQ